MSDSRLLIAIEVLDFLRSLSRRELGVHVFGKFAIKFWDDFADRHVKILDLHLADRSR
jgi:hypothetical protein